MGKSAHIAIYSIKKATIPTLVLTNRFEGSEQQPVHSQPKRLPLQAFIYAFYAICIITYNRIIYKCLWLDLMLPLKQSFSIKTVFCLLPVLVT